MVIHDFLPRHNAGSEIYTYTLARQLIARGHEVLLVYTESYHDRRQYKVSRGEIGGIPYREIVYNSRYRHFRETYLNPAMDRIFHGILHEFRPEIVHLQHLQHLSLGIVDLVHEQGIPVVYTLHEYCLTCVRRGLRMTEELELCDTLDASKCAGCIPDEPVRIPPEPTPGERVAAAYELLLPARIRRFIRKRLVTLRLVPKEIPTRPTLTPEDDLRWRTEAIEERWAAVRQRIPAIDLFIAPSPFLRSKFLEFGVPEEKIVHSDYGFDSGDYGSHPRERSDTLSFGYIGTLVEHKGVHTLIAAMNRLDPGTGALHVWGDATYFPDYSARIEELARHPGIHFEGAFDNKDVARILARVDVLVVPSLWFENSPLTIHEAFLAGVPVITTDLGGMRDLVQDGVSGLLFARGDDEDLARRMRELLEDPPLLERLRKGIPAVKTIEEDARWMEERYALLLRRRRGEPAKLAAGEERSHP